MLLVPPLPFIAMSPEPSFFSLFKRGRYYRAPGSFVDDDDAASSTQLRPERLELERFTAAALAFCFKHDPMFRQHFWERVFQLQGDPATPISPTIEVEPDDWADLLIRSNGNGKRLVHVVECKVGAELGDHQNPNHPSFASDGGYAAALIAHEGALAELRYVVLGYKSDLLLPARHPTLPIQLAQRQWSNVEEGAPSSPLIVDLFDSLGELGVGTFRMRKTKTLKISGGLQSVGNAWVVLKDTISNLNLVNKSCSVEAGTISDAESCLGCYVCRLSPAKQSPGPHLKLQTVTQSQGEFLSWFGYVSKSDGAVQRAVWLYCGDESRAIWMIAALKPMYPHVHLDSDNDQSCVVIDDADAPSLNDLDWFSAILKTVGQLNDTATMT